MGFLCGALLAALAVRIVFYGGIVSIDDINYLRHAAEVMSGRYNLGDVLYPHGTRPLLFYPPAGLLKLFGVSEAVAIMWPLLASLGTIVLLYFLARMLFDREHARYAVMIAVFLPLMVRESTRLLPGAIMNLIVAASALCFVASEAREGRRWAWLVVSGGLWGAITLAGELGLLLGAFFLSAVLLIRRYSLWSYWPVAAGFGGVIFLITIYQWTVTGDPFFKSNLSQIVFSTETRSFDPLFYVNHIVRPFASHC